VTHWVGEQHDPRVTLPFMKLIVSVESSALVFVRWGHER
jgi:hypothetical protein